MRAFSAAILILWLLIEKCPAAEHYDVFYIAIGSSSYAIPHAEGVKGLPPISGAAKSAKAVAGMLTRGGSVFGITLVSDDNHVISRQDFEQTLTRIWQEIQKLKPQRPLLVFYYAGHGVADGLTWMQFLPMGTFAFRGEPSRILDAPSSELEKSGVYTLGLVPALNWMNIPFVLLLDTCYEGEMQKFKWETLKPAGCDPADMFCSTLMRNVEPLRKFDVQMQEVTKGLNDLAASFRKMNRFEDSYPVIYSVEPGNIAFTVPDPDRPKDTPIAPLARRATLILGPVLATGQSLPLATFLKQMVAPNLDTATGPGITYSKLLADSEFLLVDARSSAGRTERMVGTATTPVVCCNTQ